MNAPDLLFSQTIYSAPNLPSTSKATTFQTQLCEYDHYDIVYYKKKKPELRAIANLHSDKKCF